MNLFLKKELLSIFALPMILVNLNTRIFSQTYSHRTKNDRNMDIIVAGAAQSDSHCVALISNGKEPQSPLPLNRWSYIQIDTIKGQKSFGLSMGDLNGDGKSDIASGRWIYFNPGGNMTGEWQRKTIPIDADILLQVDVDDDERSDLIAEDGSGNIYWLEMNDNKGGDWSYRLVGNVGNANHHLSSQGYELVDIEEGGKLEIVVIGGEQPNGVISYFKIPPTPTADEWVKVTVASPVYPEGVGYADIDDDGDIDLCSTSDVNTVVAWYENPGNGQGNWRRHKIGVLNGADRFRAGDMDNDGYSDIIVTGANQNENGIFWFKAHEKPKTNKWAKITIINAGTENSMNSMDIADLDQDGDLDIVSGTHQGELKVTLWENNGKGKFNENPVDIGKESHLGSKVWDMDSDGDLDIVSIAWDKYQYVHLWRNDAIIKVVDK